MISIDTNLFLYAANRDCEEHEKARAFLETCGERADVAVAELVLVELYVLLRNPAVIERPLTAEEAAAHCQVYRRHPHWALVENAEVMFRVWSLASSSGVAKTRFRRPPGTDSSGQRCHRVRHAQRQGLRGPRL